MSIEADVTGKVLESGILGVVALVACYVAYRIGIAYKAQTEQHQVAMDLAYKDYLSRSERNHAEHERIQSEMATAAREERKLFVESLDRNTHAFNELYKMIEAKIL